MRLTTWNVLNGRSVVDGGIATTDLLASVTALGPDVLALQEVDRGQPRSHGIDQTAEIARVLDAAHWRFQPALIGVPGDRWRAAHPTGDDGAHPAYGVALVCRYPVVRWRVLPLPAPPIPVAIPLVVPGRESLLWVHDEPRVALAAVVHSPAGLMTVVCTHLSFVPGWNRWQLRRLARSLRRLPGPHVVLGDLNLSATALMGAPFRSLARHPTYPSSEPRVQLDHVLASGPLPAVRGSSTRRLPVSDHLALSVDL